MKKLSQRWPLIAGAKADEADQADVQRSLNDDQFTEIFVDCHQHTRFGHRPAKDFGVARIKRLIADPDNIMPRLPHDCGGAS